MKIIRFNLEKREKLLKERGIDLEEIQKYIKEDMYMDIIPNPNYDNQKYYICEIDNYIVIVPFIENETEIFIKTAFKSRKLNKIYNLHNYD